ncbi:MAG: gas vesicle protein, partial [Microcoleus sp. SIO2G3]|nr:gas vesicle protein [Microcoleus sp. SIO2G3]
GAGRVMYAYTFLADSARSSLILPPGLVGNLAIVQATEIIAIVEPELDLEMIQGSDEQLMRAVLNHDRVIRELFEQTTLLPLRFGTYFVSEAGLVEHLQSHQLAYVDQLKLLTGKAEYSLKCLPKPSAEPVVSLDLEGSYFLAQKQRYQQQTQQQQMQHVQLQSLQSAIAQTYPVVTGEPQDDGLERLYLLVDRSLEAQLQQQYQQWQSQSSLWQLSLGTALPPYHFV